MTKPSTGGAAFPTITANYATRARAGMTLRDWFAGMALQGLLGGGGTFLETSKCLMIARGAYAIADAMLEKRDSP